MSEKIRIVHADELPLCECCGEPWCEEHGEHYADYPCIGPSNAEDDGYELIEENGTLYAIRTHEQ